MKPSFLYILRFSICTCFHVVFLEFTWALSAVLRDDPHILWMDELIVLSSSIIVVTILASFVSIVFKQLMNFLPKLNSMMIANTLCFSFFFLSTFVFLLRWMRINNIIFGPTGIRAVIGLPQLLAVVSLLLILCLIALRKKLKSPFQVIQPLFNAIALPVLVGSLIIFISNFNYGELSPVTISDKSKNISEMPNIIVLLFDGFTSRHISHYGYNRKTTPNLDKLSRESHVFLNAHSPTRSTFFSTGGLYTGKHPVNNFKFYEPGSQWKKNENVFQVLKSIGYQTTAITHHDIPSL